MKSKKMTIDTDEKSLAALSDKTIEKMAKATDNPEVFRAIISDLKQKALEKKQEVSLKIDTDASTLSSLSEETVAKMVKASPNPELMKVLFSDLKKAAKGDKSPNKHIFWSWSVT